MQITITGSPKEIAALVDELQERRAEYERKSQVNRILEAFRVRDSKISTAKVGIGLKAEKLGDFATETHKIADHAVTTDMLAKTTKKKGCAVFDEASIKSREAHDDVRSVRSRGFEDSKMPTVLIEIQLSADKAERLRWAKVLGWIRKIRRRYLNTDGVEYRVFLNLPDQ